MIKEELKQEANKYAKEITEKYVFMEHGRASALGYLAGAEPREKQIEIDAEQIRALQKQNGELTDKVNDLEDKLANADYQLEGRDNEIKELKAQIEKMKCCGNCRFSESDKLNGTFCHREGCFVVASAKCKLWEN